MNGANQAVSAGIWGFLAFFVLAVALWLLVRNMNGRLRHVQYEEEDERAHPLDDSHDSHDSHDSLGESSPDASASRGAQDPGRSAGPA